MTNKRQKKKMYIYQDQHQLLPNILLDSRNCSSAQTFPWFQISFNCNTRVQADSVQKNIRTSRIYDTSGDLKQLQMKKIE